MPVIDLSRCEAKGPCIEVCPYDVLAMHEYSKAELVNLSWVGRLKTWVHGKEKAFAIYPEACQACGLCVQACPEKAIKLVPFQLIA